MRVVIATGNRMGLPVTERLLGRCIVARLQSQSLPLLLTRDCTQRNLAKTLLCDMEGGE